MPRTFIYLALTLAAAGCAGGKYVEAYLADKPPATLPFYPPEQVTAGNESNFAPDLSPNGEYVVYTSDKNGNKDVWEKRTSGGFGRPLTRHAADDFSPVISPDGEKIAFVSRREDAAGDIHILRRDFTFRGITAGSEGDVRAVSSPATEDTNPAWFPDGDKLVFAARRPGDKVPTLMLAELADLKPEPLADLHGDQPSVSPDGQAVVFARGGALFIYHIDTDKTEQLTDGRVVQDGQPRYTPDGTAIVFVRYADDTNHDGKLNGDDRSTIWRLDLAKQRRSPKRENYLLTPLTSAAFASYSPQIRNPYLYVALQTGAGLDIFRFPAFGQVRPGTSLEEVRKQFDRETDPDDKTFVLRRAEAAFAARGDERSTAEAALLELDWLVQNGRRTEATWASAKLKANATSVKDVLALADLDLVSLDLRPLAYPDYKDDLTAVQKQTLTALLARVSQIQQSMAPGSAGIERVTGRSLLVKAEILAAQRQISAAQKILAQVVSEDAADRELAASAAYYAARVTASTSDSDTGVKALRDVAAKYSENRGIVLRAANDAVALLENRKDQLEALVALRTEASGIPLLPALAHMRIAKLYLAQGKDAVAANELRQIVDLYPDSPEIILKAAARLSILDEKSGRYDSSEAMLQSLREKLEGSKPEYLAEAQRLLVEFLLRRGEGLLKENEPGMAIKEYEKVIALEPLNVSAHRGKIDAAFRRKALEPLKAAYEKDARAHPDSAERLYFWGYAKTYEIDVATSPRIRLAAIDECIDILEQARQINGQILHIHQTLGWLYLQRNFTAKQYYRSGSVIAKIRQKYGMVRDFFGTAAPDWRELSTDAYQNAYFLSRPGSVERAGLAQNLGQSYYSLKNYQKALSYYMQRVKLLPVIPMRDPRAAAILFDRAGRSAFQTDDLKLAESLQRRALSAWETINNDERIAYSIDALALTLREREEYADAAALYERLVRINRRVGAHVNLVASLSNLGYCAFMNKHYREALADLGQAEAALADAHAAEVKDQSAAASGKKAAAITVDLGGQGSAAQGFDLFARHNLILTFRAKIYEKMDRLDLALATFEKKLALLTAQRAKLMDEGQDKKTLAEDIAILQNNIGALSLRMGYHSKARAAFQAAQESARLVRPDGQKYPAQGEVVNELDRARVDLRLASLGLLDQAELQADVKDLEAGITQLRPVYQQGDKAEGRALAQYLELATSLRAVTGASGGGLTPKADLEEAIRILSRLEVPFSGRAGVLLTYQDLTGGQAKSKRLQGLVRDFRKQALASPALEWKLLASEGQDAKAFEALDRYVLEGGILRSPTDRMLAREVFERVLEGSGADPKRQTLLLRRFLLLKQLDLAHRALMPAASEGASPELPANLKQALTLKEPAALDAALGQDAILVAHRTLKGRLYLSLFKKGEVLLAAVDIPDSMRLAPAAYSRALTTSPIGAALPPPGGRLYIVPSAELYEVPWEELLVGGERLASRNVLAFLPAPDVLPTYDALKRLPKATIGQVKAVDDGGIIQAANIERDYTVIPLDGSSSIGEKFAGLDLVHVDAPLYLNDVAPGVSAVRTSAHDENGAYANDLTLRHLSGLKLDQTTAIIFANLHREALDLVKSGEGHDGWAFLSLAAAAAGVPSVLAVEAPAPGTAPSSATARPNWSAFYKELDQKSLGEALQVSRIPGRLLGYIGIPAVEEVAYAKAHLEKAVDDGDDAKDDGNFGAAASAYKRALYYSRRLGRKDGVSDILDGLVQALYQKLDYAGALHFQKKIIALKKPLPKGQKPATDGSDDDRDPLDYGKAVTDAAVLAVRGKAEDEAAALLKEAESVFTSEDEPKELGKVWQYRGISLENQKRYQDTIAAYEKSRSFYLSSDKAAAASQLLNIGNVYGNDLSDYAKALDYYEQAAAEFKQLGKQDAYLPVEIDRANTLMAIGQLDQAIDLLEHEVVPAIDHDKQRVLWVRATQILANAYYRAGLYQEAQDLNDKTLAQVAKIEPKLARVGRQVDAIGLRGMILAKLGRHKEGFQAFREAIAMAQQYSLKSQVALLYNNYGFWAREYGAVDQSIDFFNIAAKIDEDLKSRSSLAYDHRNMGLSIILKGDYHRARDLLEEALKTSLDLHLSYNTAYCYFGLGDVALREKQWDVAATAFKNALTVSEQGSMQDFVWRAHAGIGAAFAKRGQWQEAAAAYGEATAVIEKLSAGLKSEDSRSAFQSDSGVQEVYQAYAVALMQLGRVEAAWQVSEQARSRAFIDSFGTQKLQFARAESAELLAEERRERGEAEDLARRLTDATDQTKAKAALDDARKRHEQTLARIQEVDAQLLQFVRVDAISKEELAKILPADTAVLEYMVTPDYLLVWVVQDATVQGKAVAVTAKDLAARVKDFRLLMENYSTTDYLGRELAGLLLDPVKDALSKAQRLAIVPHGVLHFLSFAALPYGESGYLLDRFPLYYLDSATLARYTHAGKKEPRLSAGSSVLALANPSTGEDLPDLPFAAKEVEAIGRYFPKETREEGAAASETLLKKKAINFDILHIAAHGDFNPSTPAASNLLLAPSANDDGHLSTREIYTLATKADMVTLSACDSGLGSLSAGDEIIGMDRAFFYAGANTVVASLWRISDVASAVTMKRFYRYLSEGLDKAEAMRQAQLVVRRYFKHPAYWSAFRVLGDDR